MDIPKIVDTGVAQTGQIRDPVRAVIYCRTSTVEQKGSLDAQEAACRALCQQLGVSVHAVYVEHASGGLSTRLQLARALEDLRMGRADTLVFHRWDRLARDAAKSAHIIRQALDNDWLLIPVKEDERAFSLHTPISRMSMQIMCSFHEMFLGVQREAQAVSIAHRRKVGLANGPLWGFKLTGPQKMRAYVPDERNGAYEKLIKVLAFLDSQQPSADGIDVGPTELARKCGLYCGPHKVPDATKAQRIWTYWVSGRYKALVPDAHTGYWRKYHDRYLKQARAPHSRTRMAAGHSAPDPDVSGHSRAG